MKKNERPKPITTLDELQALVSKPIPCAFKLDGQEVELALKRATPLVEETCRRLLRACQPPWKPDRKDYDLLDAKYLADRDDAAKKARSFTVYSCCETIAAKKPGLTGVDEIHGFVRGLLTENILELIEMTAKVGGMNIEREVLGGANFTPAPGSED
jgi:hypothetical protein